MRSDSYAILASLLFHGLCFALLLATGLQWHDKQQEVEVIYRYGESKTQRLEEVRPQRAPDIRAVAKSKPKASGPKLSSARPTTAASKRSAPRSGLGTDDLRAQYIHRLREMIEEKKVYPRLAKKMRQAGRVMLGVKLLKDGSLVEPRIIQASPYKRLNRAALKLISDIRKMDPIPESLDLSSWDLQIPVNYVLR